MADWKEGTKPPENQVDWNNGHLIVSCNAYKTDCSVSLYKANKDHPICQWTKGQLKELDSVIKAHNGKMYFNQLVRECITPFAFNNADQQLLKRYISNNKIRLGLSPQDVVVISRIIREEYKKVSTSIIPQTVSDLNEQQRKPSNDTGQAPGSWMFEGMGKC